MKLRIFITIFLLCIGCLWCSCNSSVINEQVTDENIILRKILTNYLEKYFIHEQIFVSSIHSSCEKKQNQFQCDVLHNLFSDLSAAGFTYNVFNRLHNTTQGNWNSFNLVLVEDSVALQEILNEATVQPIHLNQKFFVVLTGSAETHTSNLAESLQILWKINLIDSHVLSQDATNVWALHTFLPYQNDCVTASHLRIESFTNSNFSKPMNLPIGEVYPEKMKNLNGCPLYVSVYTFWPNIAGRYNYKGFDVIITEEIVKDLNSTIVYNTQSTETEHGMVVKNRTVAEAFEVVTKGEANFTVGAYTNTQERNEILSPSDAYFYVALGFIYKERQIRLSPMASIVSPFHAIVWFTLIAILFFSVLITLLTKKFSRKWRHFIIGGRLNRTPILNAWAATLGHSIDNPQIANGRSFGNFSRTLTIFWIILWFLVRSYYEGALYNYMQGYQPQSPYDTTEKVLASNCKVVFNVNGRQIVKYYMTEDRFMEDKSSPLLEVFRNYHDGEFDGVIFSSKEFMLFFNVMYFPHRQLSFTKDQLLSGSHVFYFPKKSIFRDLFNHRIQTLHESGLIECWYMQSILVYHNKNIKESLQAALHFQNIVGIIQICATMYLISFIVFILEVMSVIIPRMKYILDYFIY